MGAVVRLNGQQLGTITDQFLRYRFPVSTILHPGTNTLTVSFGDRTIQTNGRWMACSQGWDWAPISRTGSFSYGIWKSVYVAQVSAATILHVVPQITYKGQYPVTPLENSAHAGFDVRVRVHFWAPNATNATGTLTAVGSWGSTANTTFSPPIGESSATLNIDATAADIKLWWPVGHGVQQLYNLTVSFIPHLSHGEEQLPPITITKRVGFRHFALVTGNDTNAAFVEANKGGDGSGAHGMYWRVNGAAILAKGSSMVPMEELEGRMSADAHYQLVKTAAFGGFNTLRVSPQQLRGCQLRPDFFRSEPSGVVSFSY
eukprot:SAG31_NODE_732_length_12494_cov_3.395482_8_plen_316_part_00